MSEPPAPFGAIIVAAGSGTRFGSEGPPKQYRLLAGVPLLDWAVRAFLANPRISRTVVVLPPGHLSSPPQWLARLPVELVPGGVERSDSVRHGLSTLNAGGPQRVLVHDGARPFATASLINRVMAACGEGGVVPALRVVETLKEVNDEGTVIATVDRGRYWRAQTPQAFPLALLSDLHERARSDRFCPTDDAGLLEHYGYPVRIVPGDPDNVKVTSPFDLELAEMLAQRLNPVARSGSAHDVTAQEF
ncbi:MAG: 2-C-methyl-D-erythritol 4-phosphate cytidylyltransferase [Gemmatimonadota bacterium]